MAGAAGGGMPDVLCARCFSLKNYGRVKSEAAEHVLPDFDLGRKVRSAAQGKECWVRIAPIMLASNQGSTVQPHPFLLLTAMHTNRIPTLQHILLLLPPPLQVGTKIKLQKDRRALVLCVVDVWDFDGSLPRLALKSLLPPDFDLATSDPASLGFKLMVAVNKFDLLPSQATATRVEQWVRLRLKQAGLPKPEKVFMVGGAGRQGGG